MGCLGSKTGGNSKQSQREVASCPPHAARNVEENLAEEEDDEDGDQEATEPEPPKQSHKLPWSREASKWRWLLRTTHSLVASCLYVASTWVRAPNLPVLLQFFLALLLTPPLTLAYHFLSLNKAGGYYDTYIEMFTEFPQHVKDILRRDAPQYQDEIEHERLDGIVRTVNGLETGVIFLTVSWLGAMLSGARQSTGFASDFVWRCIETAVFFLLHRLIGGNMFEGRYYGLIQPEAMWYFECVLSDPPTSRVDCRMMPVLQHPDPPY
eukprot:CAMPEP_0172656664 /NCGR_PEP_ID=MMETSP1074-20121228/1513_1 /TAXON_ID=2916 /ORGANISM="Ceratium fusus, Strain PA161109" /LENGTH=265 /DNA_ID=CAMNT_0013471541 /DNA_START=49 /DNA_END=846 /DNA_ORIENTATION=+